MLIFGHVGITLAAGLMMKKLFSSKPSEEVVADSGAVSVAGPAGFSGRLRRIVKQMDLRILMVGAMLPDIIDKPLGQLIFRDVFMNGRIFAHTLLFLVMISITGFYLYRSRQHVWVIVLSFGSALHMLEDSMWDGFLRTLLWPIMGWSFDKLELDYWLGDLWDKFLHVPSVYIPEWIGIAVFVGFGSWLVYRREVLSFFRQGRII